MRRSGFLAVLSAAPIGVAAASTPVRVAVLGDSLALATGASRADGGFIFPAFRTLLRARPGSMLDNVAIGGSTVADVLRLQAGRIAAIAPDVIVVCVGGNDVVRRTPADAFARDYAALLTALRRDAPHARLVCCGVPDVAVSPIFSDERGPIGILSGVDDTAAHQAARAHGARYVDFFTLTQQQHGLGDRFFSRDRFHPSDAGYALLKAEFEPVLLAAAER
jgi:lysophospholipase L1-like esterase